jgi:membrane-associated phospholipid phosphatase
MKITLIKRLFLMIGIICLHASCYYLVNLINSSRPESAFLDLRVFLDNHIPYLSWTWVIYYFGDVYITLFAAIIALQLPEKKFIRLILTYVGMVVTGALIQIALPAAAPWPGEITKPQLFFHELISMRPYACLPSMHVALTVLPAGVLFSVTKKTSIRFFSTIMAILISISTLTLHEHFVLDLLTGVLLGLIFYLFWGEYSGNSKG